MNVSSRWAHKRRVLMYGEELTPLLSFKQYTLQTPSTYETKIIEQKSNDGHKEACSLFISSKLC